MSSLKLHNAMWPGLVGKGDEEGQEPPISLERMLELTAGAGLVRGSAVERELAEVALKLGVLQQQLDLPHSESLR